MSSSSSSSYDIFEAISNNNKLQFQKLVAEDELVIDKRIEDTLDTTLHIASRYGHAHFVSHILRLRPELAEAVNVDQETPVHEACRCGILTVLDLLLADETRSNNLSFLAHCLNNNGQTPMSLASKYGFCQLVNRLKQFYDLDDSLVAPLHIAMSHGHSDVVLEIIKSRPSLVGKPNENGHNVLHYACQFNDIKIARVALELSPDAALTYDNNGFMPLHLAAIHSKNGEMFRVFEALAPLALQSLTKNNESLRHLAVRHKNMDAFLCLIYPPNSNHDLFHCRDQDGNTPLEDLNSSDLSISSPGSPSLKNLDFTTEIQEQRHELIKRKIGSSRRESKYIPHPRSEDEYFSTISSGHDQEPLYKVAKTILEILQSEQHRHKDQQDKRMHEMNMEGLQNARNTINIIAILIATVTFTGCLSPPGGFLQEGPNMGKAVLGHTTAFKVFAVSNDAALFLSLGIVVILVSIIPFRTTPMRRLLTITHKVLWFAVSFLAVAYIAARWATTTQAQRKEWMFPVVLAVCGGFLGVILVGLSIKLVYDKFKKSEWKRQQNLPLKSFSIISDMVSRATSGYYTY